MSEMPRIFAASSACSRARGCAPAQMDKITEKGVGRSEIAGTSGVSLSVRAAQSPGARPASITSFIRAVVSGTCATFCDLTHVPAAAIISTENRFPRVEVAEKRCQSGRPASMALRGRGNPEGLPPLIRLATVIFWECSRKSFPYFTAIARSMRFTFDHLL